MEHFLNIMGVSLGFLRICSIGYMDGERWVLVVIIEIVRVNGLD